MRRQIAAVAALAIFAGVTAADVGFNSDAYLAANPDVKAAGYSAYQHINMIDGSELAARLAATAALVNRANSGGEVKIMFCDCLVFTETAVIQDAVNWQLSSPNGKSTARAMIQDGWRVQNTVNLNAKQFYLVFVR